MLVPSNGSAEVVELGCDAETVKLIEILDNDVFFVCSFAFLLAMVFVFKPCLLTLDLWLFERATLESYMLRSNIECPGELGFSRNFSYFKRYTW